LHIPPAVSSPDQPVETSAQADLTAATTSAATSGQVSLAITDTRSTLRPFQSAVLKKSRPERFNTSVTRSVVLSQPGLLLVPPKQNTS
jgi:hypothetical protein